MTVVSIILLALLLTAIAVLHWRRNVSRLLTVALGLTAVMWYAVPMIVMVLWPDEVAERRFVPLHTFFRYAAIETFVFLVVVLFLFVPRPCYRLVVRARVAEQMPPKLVALGLIAAAFLMTGLSGILQGVTGGSYVARNAFLVTGAGSAGYNTLGTFMLIQNLLTAFAYAALLTEWPSRRATRLIHLAAAAIVAYATLELVMQGSRLALITPAALLLFYAESRRWRTRTIFFTGLIVLVGTVVIGGVISIVLAMQRGKEEIQASEALTESKYFVRTEGTDRIVAQFLDELAMKFDSFSSGALLVDRFGAGAAGMRPLHGALLSVIPRQFLTSKPVPGSIDGTYLGHPSRLVAMTVGYDPTYGNVGVSPVAVSVWQFGWIAGPLILVVVVIPYLFLVNSLLLPNSLLTRSFGIFLITIPTFVGVMPTLDLLIMNAERILVLLVLLTIALFILRVLWSPAPRLQVRHQHS